MSLVRQERLRHRLLLHHLPLSSLSVAAFLALYLTRPYRDVLSRASFATAYPALVLMAATLLIGPWNVLRKQRNPVSSDMRRDIGIWAGIFGVLHSVIGQNVHLRGRPWLYYVYEKGSRHLLPLRHDLFGLANYSGAGSLLLLIALLATSNDYSLRALGTARWKQLQRWNYAVFALAALHTIAYQSSERQAFPFVAAATICITVTVVFQSVGFLHRRRAKIGGMQSSSRVARF